jgi:hypothetical protein
MPAMTIPSIEEAPSSACGPKTSSHIDAWGLAAPRAMATSSTIAFGISVSHIHFDLSLRACKQLYKLRADPQSKLDSVMPMHYVPVAFNPRVT